MIWLSIRLWDSSSSLPEYSNLGEACLLLEKKTERKQNIKYKKKKEEVLTEPNLINHHFCLMGVTFKFSGSDSVGAKVR